MFLEYRETSSIIEPSTGFSKKYVMGLREKLLCAYRFNVKEFSEKMDTLGVNFEAIISESLIDQVIVDTVQDLKRLKNFHPVKTPNSIKEASYLAYWCIKKKPLFVKTEVSEVKELEDKHKVKMLFYNEFVMAAYIISNIFNDNEYQCSCQTKNEY